MLRRVVAWTIGAAVVLGGTTVASAHPQIDRARARFDEADLDGALGALAAAERRRDLTREDVLQLLELRALVRFTQGDLPAMEQDLVRLGSIEPAHAFGDEVPPDVVEAFARVRGDEALTVDITPRREPGGVTLEARLRGDRGGVVRSISLHGRAGSGEWQQTSAPPDEVSLTLPAAGGDVEYYAQLIGPGGAVIVEVGSRDEPQRAPGVAAARVTPDDRVLEDEEDDDGGAAWWPWAAAGAGAVVVITVVALLAAGGGDDPGDLTRPAFPTVMGF